MKTNKNNCLICNRISQIKKGINPYFVTELKTGYVVIGDFQFYKGYTLFLCKEHVSELHHLNNDFKKNFLIEMSIVAEAVFKAFNPRKLNYELLGNLDSHLHWHIFPRYSNDPNPKKPVGHMDEKEVCSEKTRPSSKELKLLKKKLLENINKIKGENEDEFNQRNNR